MKDKNGRELTQETPGVGGWLKHFDKRLVAIFLQADAWVFAHEHHGTYFAMAELKNGDILWLVHNYEYPVSLHNTIAIAHVQKSDWTEILIKARSEGYWYPVLRHFTQTDCVSVVKGKLIVQGDYFKL